MAEEVVTEDQHKMVSVKVHEDHRSDDYREFRIEPAFYKDVITILDKFEKIKSNPEDEEEEEVTTCPHGYENCDEDDFETMCDECKADRGEAIEDARMDTYGD